RRVWAEIADARGWRVGGAGERYADGLLCPTEAGREADHFGSVSWVRWNDAWMAMDEIPGPDACHAARGAQHPARRARGALSPQEKAAQAELLRCIFANPFRPVSLAPAWLTADVVRLAHAAYDERQMPSGEPDPQRLLVLADALEDPGCDDAEVLGHL